MLLHVPSAPQFLQAGAFGLRGKWTSHVCAGGPRESFGRGVRYGRNRIAEGKLPACAEMCSTKALLAGDAAVIAKIYKTRVVTRGKGEQIWGWAMAYGGSDKVSDQPGAKA
jgi:formate dehydrogenase iron-sulfur subunit